MPQDNLEELAARVARLEGAVEGFKTARHPMVRVLWVVTLLVVVVLLTAAGVIVSYAETSSQVGHLRSEIQELKVQVQSLQGQRP